MVAARELPGVNGASGVSRDAVRTLTDGLAAAGAPSVPALLHPEAGAFTLLDAFSATPAAPGGLDLAAVEARIEAVSRGRDTATSGPAKHVLGRLRTAAVQGVDLRTLSLVLLLEPARAQRAAGAVPSGLVRRLEAGRLAPREARRIVVHLLAETTAVVPTDPLTELRTLLAEGRPVAAARLLAVLDDEAAVEARRLLEARTREVEALRDEASAALREGRPDLAEQRLRAALAVAADREDLAEELAHVPLAPVTGVEVVPDGAGVRISWTAPPSHADDAVYRVVRRTDRAPRDADDGTVVADVAGARFTTDPAPPVGRPVHYAVLAGRAVGAARSSAVAASVTVVPPVADVEIVGEPGAVVGRWRAHPDAVAVRVRRHAGADHAEMTATLRGFTDTTAVEGVEYHYEIAAVYAEQGRELVAEPQAGHGGVRADSAPVTALEVAPEQDGTEVRLRVSWRTPRGADVEIRVARTPPPGEVGALLTARVVEAWGTEIPGVPRTRDGWDSLLADVPPGRVHVAAFTRAPAGRVRGRDAGHDLVPAPDAAARPAPRRGRRAVLGLAHRGRRRGDRVVRRRRPDDAGALPRHRRVPPARRRDRRRRGARRRRRRARPERVGAGRRAGRGAGPARALHRRAAGLAAARHPRVRRVGAAGPGQRERRRRPRGQRGPRHAADAGRRGGARAPPRGALLGAADGLLRAAAPDAAPVLAAVLLLRGRGRPRRSARLGAQGVLMEVS